MTRRRWRISILAAFATLAAVYPITTLFTSADWLSSAAMIIALTAAVGLVLRGMSRSRLLITGVQLVVVLYGVLVLFTRDTFFYILPTTETMEFVSRLGQDAYETINRHSAPAPLTDGVSFSLVVAVALVAVLVDAMAATWRAPAAAGLPLLTAYLITAANGSGTDASPLRYFIVPVLLWLVMIHTTARAHFGRWSTTTFKDVATSDSWTNDRSAQRALSGSAARLGVLALVAAVIIPAITPHFEPRYLTDGLGRSAGSSGSGTVGFNDTVDLRNSLVNTDQTPILRYTTTGPTPSALRAVATSHYARGEWSVVGLNGEGPDEPVPLPRSSDRKNYILTVSQNILDRPRLAAPYPVVSAPRIAGTSVSIDPVTRDLRVSRTPESYELTYAVFSPPASRLRDAGPPASPDIVREDLEVPDVAAALIQRWSDQVTAGKPTAYDKALAIQAHLRDSTRYTYSTDLPTPRGGRDVDPITAFYQTRTGYCTQFATAMIMMARAQGIPARIAIGFLPGSKEGSSNVVKASDAHAWPELYFEGSGWLRFEPTASRSGPPAYSLESVTPGDGATATGDGSTATSTRSARPRGLDEGSEGAATSQQSWWDANLTGRNLVVLISLLVVVLGTLLMPLTAWVTRAVRRRRAATRQDIVEIEWQALMSHLGDLGLSTPPGATLRTARERYITEGRLDEEHASAMRRITATLERSRYDRPERTTPDETEQLHRDIRSIRRELGRTRAWTTRVRSFLWPAEGVARWQALWRGLSGRVRRSRRP